MQGCSECCSFLPSVGRQMKSDSICQLNFSKQTKKYLKRDMRHVFMMVWNNWLAEYELLSGGTVWLTQCDWTEFARGGMNSPIGKFVAGLWLGLNWVDLEAGLMPRLSTSGPRVSPLRLVTGAARALVLLCQATLLWRVLENWLPWPFLLCEEFRCESRLTPFLSLVWQVV